jgi:putative endonuclease
VNQYYVYILASESRVLYVGVTNDLKIRLTQHRQGLVAFTAKYRIHKLVHFEFTANVSAAITRERQLKGRTRAKKIVVVEASNPEWRDLSVDWRAF